MHKRPLVSQQQNIPLSIPNCESGITPTSGFSLVSTKPYHSTWGWHSQVQSEWTADYNIQTCLNCNYSSQYWFKNDTYNLHTTLNFPKIWLFYTTKKIPGISLLQFLVDELAHVYQGVHVMSEDSLKESIFSSHMVPVIKLRVIRLGSK